MTNTNNVLVVGAGGREHTLAWALAQSPKVGTLYAAPGNAGTANVATNIPISATDIPALVSFAVENAIDLVVIGPEDPLAEGLTDALQEAGIRAFGPSRAAAQLEASKAYAKDFMAEHNIPTAEYGTFTNYDDAKTYIKTLDKPVVVKASGLAAGKGVLICDTTADALDALDVVMRDAKFGAAGDEVVIEERMEGPEVSLLAFCDGKTVAPMIPARDHKRAYDNDEGPNTGGMGAFAPPEGLDETFITHICETVIQPTVDGMAKRGHPYIGVLYAGIMLTADGPKVLEFNCRFGDPETQVILPMLDTDLFDIFSACVDGSLDSIDVRVKTGACATVVMAAPGYPGAYPKGLPISGTDMADELPNTVVFHAGTKRDGEQLVSNGGRVLAVSATGDDIDEALAKAYAGVAVIQFEQAHYRNDIGRVR